MEKNIHFNSIIKDIKKINPLFSQAKLYVLYTGMNRNASHISKESVNKAIDSGSIFNVPIVGQYIEDNKNFGDHAVGLKITEQEVKMVTNTVPYGLIPESASIYWEQVTEKDGSLNEYLVIDGALLWTGRYEEVANLIGEKFGQSMEIEIISGSMKNINNIEVYDIEEFIFSAFCILGIDRNGEGHVEPCFESGSIMAYSLDKDSFNKEFKQMISELKFSMQEGGNNMAKENKDTEVTEVEETIPTEIEIEVEETEVDETPESPKEEFEAESNDSDKPEGDTQADEGEVVETPAEDVEAVVEQSDEAEDNVERAEDFEAKFNDLSEAHNQLQSDFTNLQSELSQLQSYKRQREEDDLKSKFEGQLSDEEFTTVFADMKDVDLSVVEDKLYSIIGKKNFSMNSTAKETVNKVSIIHTEETEASPYGSIFD